MIIDSSAIVAILFKEPGFENLLQKIIAASEKAIGAPTATESAIVVSARLGRDGRALVKEFCTISDIALLPFSEEHFLEAVGAYLRFGKGRHPAALNFGDCLSYAIAKLSAAPLLYVGEDFAATDIKAA